MRSGHVQTRVFGFGCTLSGTACFPFLGESFDPKIVPAVHSQFTLWDLSLVLSALQRLPLESFLLSHGVACLVAITTIRRVSELMAFFCEKPFLHF